MRKLEGQLVEVPFDRLCTHCQTVAEEHHASPKLPESVVRLRAEIEAQKKRAKADADWLLQARPEKRLERIRRSKRLRSRPAAEELLRRSHQVASRDAAAAESMAWLAFEITIEMMAQPAIAGGLAGLADLQAHACALLGNAARVACNFEKARGHFGVGRRHLERGTGDGLLRIEFLFLEASLHKDTRQPAKALRRLGEAEKLCRDLEENHWRGKVLMSSASVLGREGDLEGALRTHRESVEALDPAREPHVFLIELQNLATTYERIGRWEEAQKVLDASEEEFLECGQAAQSSVRLYRLWTRARIAHGLGERDQAETSYLEVRQLFRGMAKPYDEALVGLDLARLYAEETRLEDVARLAEEILAAIETQPLEPEALAAVSLFAQTARRRGAIEAAIRASVEAIERSPRRTRQLIAHMRTANAVEQPATPAKTAKRSLPFTRRAKA